MAEVFMVNHSLEELCFEKLCIGKKSDLETLNIKIPIDGQLSIRKISK